MFDEYNLNVKEHYLTATESDGTVLIHEELFGTNYASNESLESPKKHKCQSIAIFVIASLVLLVIYRLKFATNIGQNSNFQGFHLRNYDLVWPFEYSDQSILDQTFKLSIQRKQNSKFGINL